ncbi:MAG: UDP-N-acetylglucosamine 2-epimerase (non-hydrolyzing) [Verrucomicrobiaceae bacterium]|nr:UDP-N-acetylglucosamine 2-epimerase (non-hydrolyzing) [Verrucomicrobiaceae bacterium]
MRILSVVGARPQFIKAAALSTALRARGHTEFLVHTGQHYDAAMSDVFFQELGIPEPDSNLNAGSGRHGEMTGAMLAGIEKLCIEQKPDVVLVYGDTNSTLAGALAAAKLNIPVAHVEAGLRSFNREMPEEINRVVTDHVSTWLFCPSPVSAENLAREGITRGVHIVGDLMCDTLLRAAKIARDKPSIVSKMNLPERGFALATIHRASNTDDEKTLRGLLHALTHAGMPVVFPMHPRCRARVEAFGLQDSLAHPNLRVIDPVGYLEMVQFLAAAKCVLTDSGGLQKEAYWMHVPCVTLRDESEWTETVSSGWNHIAGTDPDKILSIIRNVSTPAAHPDFYGAGDAAERISRALAEG